MTYLIQVAAKSSTDVGGFILDVNVVAEHDTFASALALSGSTAVWSGHNLGTSPEVGEPSHASTVPSRSLWFNWTAPTTGAATIDTVGSEIDTVLAVYTGASVGALTPIAANDDFLGTASRVSFVATAGVTYRVAVDGKAGMAGDLTVRVNMPINDSFATATPITNSGFAPISTTTIGATRELGEPSWQYTSGPVRSVWFEWTVTTSGPRVLRSNHWGVAINVFTGTSLADLRPVGENHAGSAVVTRRLWLDAGTYYVRAHSHYDVGYNFSLSAPIGPANDDFASAQPLAGATGSWPGSTNNATTERWEKSVLAGGFTQTGDYWTDEVPTVWYAWTAPTNAGVSMRTFDAGFDTVLSVYTGTAPGALTLVARNDDDLPSTSSRVRFSAAAGTTYLAQVASRHAVGDGSFSLEINAAPGNDDFANREPLVGASARWQGHNYAASSEPGEPTHAGLPASGSVWFRWTALTTGTTTIDTVGSDIDTVLAVYTGASVGSLVPIAANDDAVGTQSQLTFSAVAGTTYVIAIDGTGAASGDLLLRVNIPLNDSIDHPVDVVGSGFAPVLGTTRGTTRDLDEPWVSAADNAQSVWYRWTIPTNGPYVLRSTAGELELFRGSSFATLKPFAHRYDPPARVLRGWYSAGTYLVRASTSYGPVDFQLTSPVVAANDEFANAQPIAGATGSWAGSTTNSTLEPWEEAQLSAGMAESRSHEPLGSVWYAWTAPTTRTATFVSNMNVPVTVWRGASPRLLERVAAQGKELGWNIASFPATAGETYWIRVVSSTLTFTLTLNSPPPNDNVVNAQNLANAVGNHVDANLFGATCEVGEPTVGGLPCEGTIWYRWTATTSGLARMTTWGSAVDTTLGVYTGATIGALTQVASAVGGSDDARAAHIDMAVLAGTTYRIAVGTRGGAQGIAKISVGQLIPGDDMSTPITITGDTAVVAGSNRGATSQMHRWDDNRACISGTCPAPSMRPSIWYSWTPAYTGLAQVALAPGPQSSLAVYRADSGEESYSIFSASTTWSPTGHRVAIPEGTSPRGLLQVTAGVTYLIQASTSTSGNWGTHAFTINPPTPSESFATPTTLGPDDRRVFGVARMGSIEPGEPDHAGAGSTKSLWWTWTADASGPVSFTTAHSVSDTALAVYTGSTLGALALVAEDNASIQDDGHVEFTATVGVEYRIAVGVTGPGVADVVLRRDAPRNDDSSRAQQLVGSSIVATFDVANGVEDLSEYLLRGYYAGDSSGPLSHYSSMVWYEWEAPSADPVVLWTSNSAESPTMHVLRGADPATRTRVATSYAYGGTRVARVAFVPVAGETYAIGLALVAYGSDYEPSDGIAPLEGRARIHIEQTPRNDNLADATDLVGWNASLSVSNARASRESAEPSHANIIGGHSVWYRWVAPSTGRATIDTADEDFDTIVEVYTGGAGGYATLTPVDASDDFNGVIRSQAVFSAVAGTAYYIAVDGYRGDFGRARIRTNPVPDNDDFANAFVIDGDIARTSGASLNATTQPTEPDHAVVGSTETVWWEWTPSYNHTAIIDTYGSDYDTVLGVYTGSSLATLALTAANDDDGSTSSRVSFAAVAGTTYRIAVGGKGTAGVVRIRVNPQAPLVPELIAPIASATSPSRFVEFTLRLHHEDAAVLIGGELEYCADPVAPAHPWALTCTTGYGTMTVPALYGDASVASITSPAMLDHTASYRWRARTVDDAGVVSPWSAPESFEVDATQSLALTGLGRSASTRSATTMQLGEIEPGQNLDIGPAGSGQTTPGAAFEVEIDAETPYVVTSQATAPDNGAGSVIPLTQLRWKDHAAAGDAMTQSAWLPFTGAATQVESSPTAGARTFRHDLRFAVPALAAPGDYTFDVTYTVAVAP